MLHTQYILTIVKLGDGEDIRRFVTPQGKRITILREIYKAKGLCTSVYLIDFTINMHTYITYIV